MGTLRWKFLSMLPSPVTHVNLVDILVFSNYFSSFYSGLETFIILLYDVWSCVHMVWRTFMISHFQTPRIWEFTWLSLSVLSMDSFSRPDCPLGAASGNLCWRICIFPCVWHVCCESPAFIRLSLSDPVEWRQSRNMRSHCVVIGPLLSAHTPVLLPHSQRLLVVFDWGSASWSHFTIITILRILFPRTVGLVVGFNHAFLSLTPLVMWIKCLWFKIITEILALVPL